MILIAGRIADFDNDGFFLRIPLHGLVLGDCGAFELILVEEPTGFFLRIKGGCKVKDTVRGFLRHGFYPPGLDIPAQAGRLAGLLHYTGSGGF
jgi:hypothetical protein